MSPTQLTLRHMRRLGYMAAVVEHWNPHVKIRQDLFGIIDVIAVGPNETVGIQCCAYSGMSKRVKKMVESDAIGNLRDANWTLLVQGWHQPRGKGTRYKMREVDIS